jgi:hypothetical protein
VLRRAVFVDDRHTLIDLPAPTKTAHAKGAIATSRGEHISYALEPLQADKLITRCGTCARNTTRHRVQHHSSGGTGFLRVANFSLNAESRHDVALIRSTKLDGRNPAASQSMRSHG